MGLAPTIRRSRLLATAVLAPLAAASTYLVAAPALAQAGTEVTATNTNQFMPPTLEVPVGTTVTWKNEGGFHTVTGGTGPEADPKSPIGDNPLTAAGATVQVKFDEAGTFPYFCQPHLSQGMKGEIVVTGAAGGGAAPGAPTVAPSGSAASGAPRPDADPSDADPAKVDPGAVQASESSGPGEENTPEDGSIPGASAEDNKTLREIEEQRAANEGQLGGFDALLAAGSLALIALCVAIFASTRPRRAGR